MQTIRTANELLNERLDLSSNINDLNDLIEDKCEEASKLIREIRKL